MAPLHMCSVEKCVTWKKRLALHWKCVNEKSLRAFIFVKVSINAIVLLMDTLDNP